MSLNRHYTVRCDECGANSGLPQAHSPYRARWRAKMHGWGRVPIPDNQRHSQREKNMDLCPDCLAEREAKSNDT